jgi:hypothetical protein
MHMLYTFELTETELDRVTLYLDQQDCRQYILSVNHRLFDHTVFVIIDCSPETATFLHLLV